MTLDVKRALQAALDGDTSSVEQLTDDASAAAAAAELGPLVLQPNAVAKVLDDFVRARISEGAAWRWATWIRAGYVPGRGVLPSRPLAIAWPDEFDEAISEAVMRLSELGDAVDGQLRPGEADQLLAALR